MGDIFIIGDVHGDYNGFYHSIQKIEQKEGRKLNENDVLIVAGDAGFVFRYDNRWNKERKKRIKKLNDYPFTLCVVLGNHDNYDEIYRFDIVEKFGAKAYKEKDVDVYYFINGETATIQNKKFWFYGGGLSIDKMRRDIHLHTTGEKVWWPQEIDEKNFEKGIDFFKDIDFMVTHDVPKTIFIKLSYEFGPMEKICSLQDYFELFYETNDFEHWYAGHYHPPHKTTYHQKFTVLNILGFEKIKKRG